MDDGGGDAGAVAAVTLIDVLDHLFAAFVFEIDVDIGGFAAFGGNEAFEQQVDLGGVDRGDAEAVADGGVGGRAAALAEDALGASESHNVVDGEEIGRVGELGDHGQLLFQGGAELGLDASRVAGGSTLPGEGCEMGVWRGALGDGFVGVLVRQFVQTELAQAAEVLAVGDGVWMVSEQAGELGGGFEVAFGVGGEG